MDIETIKEIFETGLGLLLADIVVAPSVLLPGCISFEAVFHSESAPVEMADLMKKNAVSAVNEVAKASVPSGGRNADAVLWKVRLKSGLIILVDVFDATPEATSQGSLRLKQDVSVYVTETPEEGAFAENLMYARFVRRVENLLTFTIRKSAASLRSLAGTLPTNRSEACLTQLGETLKEAASAAADSGWV